MSALAPSTINLRAFTALNAIVAIYAVDAADAPEGDPVTLLVDALPISPQVESIAVRQHGVRWSAVRHVDESWVLELSRPRFIELSSAGAAVEWQPTINTRYAIVVVWHDAVRGFWEKQVFLGVTGFAASLDDTNVMSRIPLRAERRSAHTAGHATQPTLAIVATEGSLEYIGTDGARTPLYTFTTAGGFAVVNPALIAARATVTVNTTSITILFGAGAAVFTANATGVTAASFDETGGTYGSTSPRVEFLYDGVRLATLSSAGVLNLASLTEQATAPVAEAGDMKVNDSDGDWLFTLRPSGLFCKLLTEL